MLIFLLKLLAITALYVILIAIFHRVVSKWLKMKRRKAFSHEVINERHKKGDKLIGNLTVLAMVAGFIMDVSTDVDPDNRFLQPYLIIAFFVVGRLLYKFYMEKKWLRDKRESVYTLMEAGFYTLLFAVAYSTNFWMI
ncbi:DUF4181 domain-containing protein [Rossellomorea sp. NPDC077527]|uniref:DUF4181 domain-containing protein n=1 Tax=Rossellomorea sp. NPDC077527 TaxID=3364510 RepID=UPI0037CA6042